MTYLDCDADILLESCVVGPKMLQNAMRMRLPLLGHASVGRLICVNGVEHGPLHGVCVGSLC